MRGTLRLCVLLSHLSLHTYCCLHAGQLLCCKTAQQQEHATEQSPRADSTTQSHNCTLLHTAQLLLAGWDGTVAWPQQRQQQQGKQHVPRNRAAAAATTVSTGLHCRPIHSQSTVCPLVLLLLLVSNKLKCVSAS